MFFPGRTLPMCQCDNAMNAAGMEAAANAAQLSVHTRAALNIGARLKLMEVRCDRMNCSV